MADEGYADTLLESDGGDEGTASEVESVSGVQGTNSLHETILVPIDGSDPANRAVEHALALADRYDASVHALYCVETSRYGEPALSSAELVLNQFEERGDEILEEVGSRADARGVEYDRTICHGRPWKEIQKKADDVDADLVVIGIQGLSHKRTNKIGSVADRVVRSVDQPVLTA